MGLGDTKKNCENISNHIKAVSEQNLVVPLSRHGPEGHTSRETVLLNFAQVTNEMAGKI